jgi:hypothetical protein
MKSSHRINRLAAALAIMAIPAANGVAGWWMQPSQDARDERPPQWIEVRKRENFQNQPAKALDLVLRTLKCSYGWMGTVRILAGGPKINLGWFEWSDKDTPSTLEAFQHLPEECMGSAGLPLEEINPPRSFQFPEGLLVFDSTTFRRSDGGPAVHVFKAVWVAGFQGLNLREEGFGNTDNPVRRLRFKAAATRFSPPRAAVLMASVTGMPTEGLAWDIFRQNVLVPEAQRSARSSSASSPGSSTSHFPHATSPAVSTSGPEN